MVDLDFNFSEIFRQKSDFYFFIFSKNFTCGLLIYPYPIFYQFNPNQ